MRLLIVLLLLAAAGCATPRTPPPEAGPSPKRYNGRWFGGIALYEPLNTQEHKVVVGPTDSLLPSGETLKTCAFRAPSNTFDGCVVSEIVGHGVIRLQFDKYSQDIGKLLESMHVMRKRLAFEYETLSQLRENRFSLHFVRDQEQWNAAAGLGGDDKPEGFMKMLQENSPYFEHIVQDRGGTMPAIHETVAMIVLKVSPTKRPERYRLTMTIDSWVRLELAWEQKQGTKP